MFEEVKNKKILPNFLVLNFQKNYEILFQGKIAFCLNSKNLLHIFTPEDF